jgi:hypothetical protein
MLRCRAYILVHRDARRLCLKTTRSGDTRNLLSGGTDFLACLKLFPICRQAAKTLQPSFAAVTALSNFCWKSNRNGPSRRCAGVHRLAPRRSALAPLPSHGSRATREAGLLQVRFCKLSPSADFTIPRGCRPVKSRIKVFISLKVAGPRFHRRCR